jgi:hypothetical protein
VCGGNQVRPYGSGIRCLSLSPLFSSLYFLALAEALETTKIHSVVFPCAMNYRNSGAQVLEMIGSL